MSAADIPLAAFLPDPAMLREDRPSRFARLVGLVRKLIHYGKGLAATLQQQQRAPTAELAALTHPFGTRDIGLILARITRGLLWANALEARVVRMAARPAPPASPARASTQSVPRAPRPAAAVPNDEPDPRLARLPSPEQIAAEVRRRPVGAVIADICRDLGILPSHPIWQEMLLVVVRHGGSVADLFTKIVEPLMRRSLPSGSATPPAAPPPAPAATATGPP